MKEKGRVSIPSEAQKGEKKNFKEKGTWGVNIQRVPITNHTQLWKPTRVGGRIPE